jgi:ribosomal protein S18 acetylase RimI-like enzyme
MPAMSPTIAVATRAIGPDDEPFLRRVYAGTRAEELAIVPWDDAQKDAFLAMQFDAQHRYYHDQFPDASFDLILRDGEPVGRLYVDRRDDEIRIIDIALLPEARGEGIGGKLLGDLLAEAGASDKPIRIHVERYNRAMSLYVRLGFVSIGESELYFLMERSPGVEGT